MPGDIGNRTVGGLNAGFDVNFVALSVLVSFIGTYTSLQCVELYRVKIQSHSAKVRWVLVMFAVALGSVGIWCMHFIGMKAYTIEFVFEDASTMTLEDDFSLFLTILSWLCAVLCCYVGALVATRDNFFGRSVRDVVEELKNTAELENNTQGLLRKRVAFVALFTKMEKIVQGGSITAMGVLIMHYIGMVALDKSLVEAKWKIEMIVLTIVIANCVATVGYWISFRFLQWKPFSELERILAAMVITAAVCVTHYIGMLGVRYENKIGLTENDILYHYQNRSSRYSTHDNLMVSSTELYSFALIVSFVMVVSILHFLISLTKRATRNAYNTNRTVLEVLLRLKQELESVDGVEEAIAHIEQEHKLWTNAIKSSRSGHEHVTAGSGAPMKNSTITPSQRKSAAAKESQLSES